MDLIFLLIISGILHFVDFYYTNKLIHYYVKKTGIDGYNHELNKLLRYFMKRYGVNKGMLMMFPFTLSGVFCIMYFISSFNFELFFLGMLSMVAYTNLMSYNQLDDR